MRTLAVQGNTASAAGFAVCQECGLEGARWRGRATGLAELVERHVPAKMVCGGDEQWLIRDYAQLVYRKGQRVGLVPSGVIVWILAQLVRPMVMQVIVRLIEHWLQQRGSWS